MALVPGKYWACEWCLLAPKMPVLFTIPYTLYSDCLQRDIPDDSKRLSLTLGDIHENARRTFVFRSFICITCFN